MPTKHIRDSSHGSSTLQNVFFDSAVDLMCIQSQEVEPVPSKILRKSD